MRVPLPGSDCDSGVPVDSCYRDLRALENGGEEIVSGTHSLSVYDMIVRVCPIGHAQCDWEILK